MDHDKDKEINIKVIAKVKKFLINLGDTDREVQITDKFSDYKRLDSLDHVELIMGVEDAFNIHFSNTESENIKTVQDLINCVSSKIK